MAFSFLDGADKFCFFHFTDVYAQRFGFFFYFYFLDFHIVSLCYFDFKTSQTKHYSLYYRPETNNFITKPNTENQKLVLSKAKSRAEGPKNPCKSVSVHVLSDLL